MLFNLIRLTQLGWRLFERNLFFIILVVIVDSHLEKCTLVLLNLLDEGLRKLELGRLDIVKLVLQVATGHSSVSLPQWGLCHVI